MKRTLPAVGHQDFHLPEGEVLDVLVLGARVLDVALAAEADGLVLFLKHAGPLDAQSTPFLGHAG